MHKDSREHKVPEVLRVLRVIQVLLDSKVLRVPKVRKGHKER